MSTREKSFQVEEDEEECLKMVVEDEEKTNIGHCEAKLRDEHQSLVNASFQEESVELNWTEVNYSIGIRNFLLLKTVFACHTI